MQISRDSTQSQKILLRSDTYDPTKPFNAQIRELITSTHPPLTASVAVRPFGKRFITHRDEAHANIFSGLTGTDGIGTKGLLHWQMGTEQNGAQDAFAMVADDLIESGHVITHLQDHLIMEREDKARIMKVITALTGLAKAHKWKDRFLESHPVIIDGGETAILNTMQGFELGITGTGYVRKGHEITANVKEGDMLIGLSSDGVHSNGLTFLRSEFEKRGIGLDGVMPWNDRTVGEELTRPTAIYLGAIKELIEHATDNHDKASNVIHGMVHITGGGLSKLKELLAGSKGLDVEMDRAHNLVPHGIFEYAHREFKVSSRDMYTRFNNGIGYVAAVDPSYVDAALKVLGHHRRVDVIGKVKNGNGNVLIDSSYENVTLTY